jgi:hypothetical protein
MKLICFLGLLACATANAAPIAFQSSERQTPLLELYTSEGCSSCPPAELWLSKLKNSSGLWSEFVPVAFHVDYWNNHAWSDKFSSEQYSIRQRDYAQVWSAENIYTPEFVLSGKEWRNWFEIRSAPSASATKVGVLQASSDDGKHWQAHFIPAENGTVDYEVTAALLVSETSSDVKGGENAGRHLNHDFAALSLITRPLASQTNGFRGQFVIDDNPKGITGRLALAVWVTRGGHLEPLQATGGWLPQKMLSATQSTQPQK